MPKISNMCPESNENMPSRLKIYDAIMSGKEQADKGDLIDGAEAMQKMREKYGV